jgi:hypothetical protein
MLSACRSFWNPWLRGLSFSPLRCVQAYVENKIGDNLLEMTCPDFATPAQVYI